MPLTRARQRRDDVPCLLSDGVASGLAKAEAKEDLRLRASTRFEAAART